MDSASASVTWGDLEGGGHGARKRKPQVVLSSAAGAMELTPLLRAEPSAGKVSPLPALEQGLSGKLIGLSLPWGCHGERAPGPADRGHGSPSGLRMEPHVYGPADVRQESAQEETRN